MITSPTTDVPTPTTLTQVLVIAVVALAGVIVFLFKFYTGRLSVLEEGNARRAFRRLTLPQWRTSSR